METACAIVHQPYGFPHWDSKTTVSPAFWLFLDVQKLKKTNTTYAEHFSDAHKGAICDNAVVVVQKSGKKIKNPFKGRKNKIFWSNRLILIRNHARNPKKSVLMLYDLYFLRKLDFFKGNWTFSKKNAQKNWQNEKNQVFSNSAELQNRPNSKYTIYILYNALYSAVYIFYVVHSIRPIRPMMRPYAPPGVFGP